MSDSSASPGRKVLLLKGLVFGIPEEKYAEALQRASDVIAASGITTVCWDGDKCTYPGEDGKPPSASFTGLLPMLHAKFPSLEFMYFKKAGKAASLIVGGEIAADDYGNVLGPIPFLTEANTSVVSAAAAAPPLAENAHYGVEFEGIAKWYELGLVGMGYIKDKLGVAAIDVLVLGLGGVVKKEDEKVGEEPDKYPARTLAVIEVQRD